MKRMNSLKYIFLLFCTTNILNGQKIQMVPKEYLAPVAYSNSISRTNFENDVLKKVRKRQKEKWIVISDKNDNPTYFDKSEDVGNIKKKLNFGDCLYVVEDHEKWIKLVKESSGKFYDYGWIPKKDVLLWRRGLLDATTKINLKGFILNHFNKFKLEKLHFAELYDGPESNNNIGKIPLHDFYFIYKIHYSDKGDPERYLLAKNQVISTRSVHYLLGWVEASKITEWNTRLCLEPNFEELAFEERKSNSKFQIHAYEDSILANKITSGHFGKHNKSKSIWHGDPSISDFGVALNSDNPRRFKGDQIRFPILNNYSGYYESGLLAELKTHNSGGNGTNIFIPEEIKEYLKKKAKNINLLLLLEGSDEIMSQHVEATKRMIKKLLKSENYESCEISIGVYKDILEKKKGDAFKFLNPTKNVEGIENFLDGIYWGQNGDYEELTCWKYALYKGIQMSSFNEEETNVIIQLGNYADLSIDEFRVEETPSEYLISKERIRNLFSEMEINWIVANISNDDSFYSNEFDNEIRTYINDFTKEIYFDYEDKIKNLVNGALEVDSDILINAPHTPKLENQLVIETKDFVTKNYFKRTLSNESMSVTEVGKFLTSRIDSIFHFNTETYNYISGKEFLKVSDNMKFADHKIHVFRKILNVINQRKLSAEEYLKIEKEVENIRFFSYAYFPKIQPKQKYEPFSLVLFMPKDDLDFYIRELDKLRLTMDLSTDRVRESLQEYFQELGQQFSGSVKLVNEMEMEDILNLMLGIEKEGYQGFMQRKAISGCKLKDITNSKKCNDEALTRFADSIINSYDRLNAIVAGKPPYEFRYSTDNNNTYYWIPVEYMY